MIYAYTLLTSMIYPLLYFLSLFSKQLQSFLLIRRLEKKAILATTNTFRQPCYWLHAASVGELDQCKSLAMELKKTKPSIFIILSVYSNSVSQKQLEHAALDFTFHLPLDFYFSYNFIFRKFQPNTLIIMAWDTWPHLLLAASRHNVRTLLTCASINQTSGRMKWPVSSLMKNVLSSVDNIFPANAMQVELFENLADKQKIGIAGDTRFDAVMHRIKKLKPHSSFEKFIKNHKLTKPVFILGSTYRQCDAMLLTAISLLPQFNFWIFPHKINPQRIEEISSSLSSAGITYSLYSQIQDSNSQTRVIIFDQLGILAFAYKHAWAAYVGGAMHNQVHNVIEPAYFGLPLFTGPRISNSPEAQELEKNGGLHVVHSGKDMHGKIQDLFAEKKKYSQISKSNKKYVIANTGFSQKLCLEIIVK